MSEELVVEQCSPTMAGLKTGNLFSCPAEDTSTLWQSIRRLNQRLVPCGIRLVPVKSLGDRELIYMYRPEKLRRDLREQGARAILREKRYPTEDPERCVVELVRRLNRGKDFRMRSDCSWVIRRRMSADLSGMAPAVPSAWALGRYTAMRNPPGRNLPCTRSAPACTAKPIASTITWTGCWCARTAAEQKPRH